MIGDPEVVEKVVLYLEDQIHEKGFVLYSQIAALVKEFSTGKVFPIVLAVMVYKVLRDVNAIQVYMNLETGNLFKIVSSLGPNVQPVDTVVAFVSADKFSVSDEVKSLELIDEEGLSSILRGRMLLRYLAFEKWRQIENDGLKTIFIHYKDGKKVRAYPYNRNFSPENFSDLWNQI